MASRPIVGWSGRKAIRRCTNHHRGSQYGNIYDSSLTTCDQETTHHAWFDGGFMVEREAWMAREAWGFSMDISDDARSHVLALRTTVVEQRALISGLQAADHQRQVQLTMALQLLKGLQTQMAEFQRQQGPAEGPAQPDAPEEAGQAKHAPRGRPTRTTRSRPVTTTPPPVTTTPPPVTDPTTTTSVTSAQLQAMIDEGVKAALAARDTTRNGDDSHSSGGTEVLLGLTRWFEKMESVFSISNCTTASQVKFATCTLQDDALTWGEIKKIEAEMWNLKVKGTDVVAYNRRFQQLALMCARMFPEESDQIERYIGGLPDMILGSVKASKSKTMQEVIEFTTELMEGQNQALCERLAITKEKAGTLAGNNQDSQQANKRQNTGRAYAAGNVDRGQYEGPRPWCSKWTYKRDCPKLKNNNNRGNRDGNAKAPTKVYAVGNTGANPDNNVVTGTFLLNNRYASILFDTGADRSFVSTTFSSRIVITPTALDHDYDVELADGRIVGLNTIIRGCTLNFLNHPFNIDLMPVELAQEYLAKGCHVFLANITATKDEDKSKGKRLEDVPVVREFPEVFPED
ncbi:putative reverse transcriptase domain-containing protein [Tanacetum coccineum]